VRREVVLPDVRRPSAVRLVTVEARKMLDTWAGRLLLAGTFALALVGVGWKLFHLDGSALEFGEWLGAANAGVILLIPVLGILAMTSEWTQRTALTTFTLVPRRGRVLGAKLTAAVLLGAALTLAVVGVAAGGALVGGTIDGQAVAWGEAGRAVGGTVVASTLNVLMGAAFGALVMYTPVAVTLFYLAPTAWAIAGPAVLKDGSEWLDVDTAFGRLSDFSLAGHWVQTGTALLFWVALPLALGTVRSLRRNVS
jgi:hypothetical protein